MTAARALAKGKGTPIYHAAPKIDGQAALTAAVEALLQRDPETIGPMIEFAGPPPLRLREPGFEGLVSIVLSQQVSVASANAIAARVADILVPLTPATIAQASETTLRACGLSGPKIRTLQAVSAAILAGDLVLDRLVTMEPAAAHRALVAVKGIGPWTADIFLLFCLGHADVWPVADIALQEAARLVLKLDERPDAAALDHLGERWRPHRGVVARMLWAYYRAAKQGRDGIALAAG
jgi:DNA-3-methyladenine glycosylase II